MICGEEEEEEEIDYMCMYILFVPSSYLLSPFATICLYVIMISFVHVRTKLGGSAGPVLVHTT